MASDTIDLREFIRRLGGAGHLTRITRPVDWRFEVGQITRETRTPLLFENVKDYPGHCVFTNGLSDIACIGTALGLDPGADRKQMMSELKRRVSTPVKPVIVESSPALANVESSPRLDLLKFPVPHWSDQETARYIGTWHINVTRDPQTGSRNVGVYRMAALGPDRATVSTSPNSHLSQHFAKAEKESLPLEMAVAIGVPESVVMAAGASYPAGCDEYELAGALQGHPVALIRCQTVRLEVPAHSEIVIEGELRPCARVQDGPYFDYSGKPDINPNAFLFEARRLTFRRNPIFRGASIGVAGAEDHQLFSVLAELGLVDFHGQRLKQSIQNELLRRHMFRAFQWTGKLGGNMSWHRKV